MVRLSWRDTSSTIRLSPLTPGKVLVTTGKSVFFFHWEVPKEETFNVQAPPKCDGCQTLLAIQQEQPHRVETAFSSPPSSADDGLDAGPEFIRKSRDSNVSNLVLSLFYYSYDMYGVKHL